MGQSIKSLLVAGLLVATPCVGLSGPVPGRWEKVSCLIAGSPIIVWMHSGDRLEGRFLELGPDYLGLSVDGGPELKLERLQVNRVTRAQRSHDPLSDGLWKGALVGSVVGTPFLIGGLRYDGGEREDAIRIAVGITVYAVLMGTGAGVIADALHPSHEVLYRAP